MLKNLVYVLAALGLIFALIIASLAWNVATGKTSAESEPTWAQQMDGVNKICDAFVATPEGLSCHLAAGAKTIKATMLKYPAGDDWCTGYQTIIRRAGIQLPGWTIDTYVDGMQTPVISCQL